MHVRNGQGEATSHNQKRKKRKRQGREGRVGGQGKIIKKQGGHSNAEKEREDGDIK